MPASSFSCSSGLTLVWFQACQQFLRFQWLTLVWFQWLSLSAVILCQFNIQLSGAINFRQLPTLEFSAFIYSAGESSGSMHSELSRMFTWKGTHKPAKRPKAMCSSSKKKKLKTWTHTFVCLASTTHACIPDANKRTSLKLAGLGKKRSHYLCMAPVYNCMMSWSGNISS